ncbi:L-fuculose-phosphate aldolase [Colletotrichum tofieldiae]|nr:L-fuculose-phosphate aldolase [Colletotrichum tofieldiae]GKT87411.1 L-fuculose-phosphate aldolase [Colletotrichum tofieldiae]
MSTTTTVTASAPAPAPTQLGSALDAGKAGSGKVKRLHQIPIPESKEAARQWQLEQMAAAFRIFAKLGFSDGSSGHISLRDPVRPDTFWINPYGVHFGVLKVSDMVHIDEDGNRIGGADNDLSVYAGFGGVVLAKEEGEHIAEALGPTNKNIILQNHGLLTAGGTVAEAAAFFIALERACQTQLLVEQATAPGTNGAANGLKKTIVGDEEAQYTKEGTGTPEVMYMQFVPEYQLILKESGGIFCREFPDNYIRMRIPPPYFNSRVSDLQHVL